MTIIFKSLDVRGSWKWSLRNGKQTIWFLSRSFLVDYFLNNVHVVKQKAVPPKTLVQSLSWGDEVECLHLKQNSESRILKIINLFSWKLQYFGHLMWRTHSLEKILMLRKIEGKRRGQQRMRWLDGITDLDISLNKLQELGWQGNLECCGPWGCKESDTIEKLNWSREREREWKRDKGDRKREKV